MENKEHHVRHHDENRCRVLSVRERSHVLKNVLNHLESEGLTSELNSRGRFTPFLRVFDWQAGPLKTVPETTSTDVVRQQAGICFCRTPEKEVTHLPQFGKTTITLRQRKVTCSRGFIENIQIKDTCWMDTL